MRALGIRSRLIGLGEAMATAGVVAIALSSLIGPALGFHVIIIAGGSMAPEAGPGSLLITSSVRPDEVAIGDVISYRAAEGTVVTHRVTRLEDAGAPGRDERFFVKGDANATPDPTPVPGSALIGRQLAVIPLVGYPIIVAARPWGLATIIALAVVALLVHDRSPASREAERAAEPST